MTGISNRAMTARRIGSALSTLMFCCIALAGPKEDFTAGMTAARGGKWADAIMFFTRVIDQGDSISPAALAETYRKRALARHRLKQYDDEINDLGHAIELDPKQYMNFHLLAQVRAKLGQYPQALIAFGQAIELKPDSAGNYRQRSKVHMKLQRYQDALNDLNRAIEIDPEFASGYLMRSRVYRKLGKDDLADADRARQKEIIAARKAKKSQQ